MMSEPEPPTTVTVKVRDLDRIDRQILRLLQGDGRITISELARSVHLTTTPCYERVKRLEREGFIRGYVALVCPQRLGMSMLAFVEVKVERTSQESFGNFQRAVESLDEVVECHMVAGGFDYLIKIRVSDMAAYRRSLGRVFSCACQHRAHGRQNLSELVVQFAGNMTQSGFLRGNELLGKFAALFGQRRELRKQSPVRADQVKAGKKNGNQNRSEKQIHLPLNAVINLRDP